MNHIDFTVLLVACIGCIIGLFILLCFCLNEFNKIELELQKERYRNKHLKRELKRIKKQYPLAEGYVLTKEDNTLEDKGKTTNIPDNYNMQYQPHDTRVCPPTEKDGVRRRDGKLYVLAWCSEYKIWMIVNVEAVIARPTFYTYWQSEPLNPEGGSKYE